MIKQDLGVTSNCVKAHSWVPETRSTIFYLETTHSKTVWSSHEHTFSSWESGSKKEFTADGKTWRGLEL